MNPIVVIPARLQSTRLPNKPLADIAGQTMIERVWRQAMKAALGPVLVAAAEQEIVDVIVRAGGNASSPIRRCPPGPIAFLPHSKASIPKRPMTSSSICRATCRRSIPP